MLACTLVMLHVPPVTVSESVSGVPIQANPLPLIDPDETVVVTDTTLADVLVPQILDSE